MTFEPDRPSRRFGLSWWAILPVLLLIVVALVTRPADQRADLAVSFAMGRVIAALLIGTVLAWLAFLVSRGSRAVATVAFSVVLVLTCLGALAARGRGGDRGVGQAKQAVADVAQELTALRASYDAAVKRFHEAGAFDPASLATRETLEARMRLLDDVRAELKRLTAAAALAPAKLDERLRAHRVPEHGARAVSDNYRASPDRAAVMQSLEHDRTVTDAYAEEMALLRDHWGAWRLDPAQRGEFSYDNDDLLQRHLAARRKVVAALAEHKAFTEAQQAAGAK